MPAGLRPNKKAERIVAEILGVKKQKKSKQLTADEREVQQPALIPSLNGK